MKKYSKKATENKDFVLRNALMIFFIINSLVYLFNFPNKIRLLVMIGTGVVGYLGSLGFIKRNNAVILLLYTILVSGVTGRLYNGNISLGNYIATIMYLGIAIILLTGKLNPKFTRIYFYGLSAFFVYNILIEKGAHKVLYHVSRNYISVLMLAALALIYISDHKTSNHKVNKKVSVLPAFVFFIISVWAVGRGGILTSGFILAFIILFRINDIKNKDYRDIIISSFIVIIVVGGVIFLSTGIPARYLSQFLIKGLETPRTIMYADYFSKTMDTPLNLIFGTPISSITEIVIKDRNLHNSFIQSHAYFGIVFFLMIITMILRALVYYYKEGNKVYLILLLGLVLRGFLDRLFFSGYMEPILYYLILYPYVKVDKLNKGKR